MNRQEVYKAIDSERTFVEHMESQGGTHIVKEFPLGSGLAALQEKINVARTTWYNGQAPHEETLAEIRKIAGICVAMGEQYGMPERDLTEIKESRAVAAPSGLIREEEKATSSQVSIEDFINEGENEFINIDSEVRRTYVFPNGPTVVIENPLKLCVKSNGHRVWDAQNVSHYIPMGWAHLYWIVEKEKPNFVK